MVAGLIRDSAFGHIVRLVTRNKAFQYPEERDLSVASRYYNTVKTRNLARYGKTAPPGDESRGEKQPFESPSNGTMDDSQAKDEQVPPALVYSESPSLHSEQTAVDANGLVRNITGTPVDPERGRDLTVIDWDGPNDPEDPQNWSSGKKNWVTFQICLLTTAVYIGSAIYTPGLADIEQVFGVSEVAGVVGLTCFVAGYGLGQYLLHCGLLV